MSTARATRPRSPKQTKGKAREETCRLCKFKFPRVTPAHLRSHGYTTQRYDRMFGARAAPDSRLSVSAIDVDDPDSASIEVIANRLTEDKRWVACLADEVGERMMNGPLRQRLAYMLTTMLSQRASVHGQALGILSGALNELKEDWRTLQGGPNAGPTDTDQLLRMVEKASKLVKDSEDAVQRTIKLALDEQKVQADYADSIGPSLYQGDGDHLDMPAGMTTGDRETVRNLLSMIGKAANEAGTIDVTPSPPAPPPEPTPVTNDAALATTLSSPVLDEGNGQMELFNDGAPVTTLHDDDATVGASDQSVIRVDQSVIRQPTIPSVDPTAITRAPRRRRKRRPTRDDGPVNDPST